MQNAKTSISTSKTIQHLTHCGLVKPYGNTDQVNIGADNAFLLIITWTNIDFSLVRFYGIHLKEISQGMLKISTIDVSLIHVVGIYFWSGTQSWNQHIVYIWYYHIEAETKWPPFRGLHFQVHFLEWKCFEFRLKFHWSLFLRVQLTIIHHWVR